MKLVCRINAWDVAAGQIVALLFLLKFNLVHFVTTQWQAVLRASSVMLYSVKLYLVNLAFDSNRFGEFIWFMR